MKTILLTVSSLLTIGMLYAQDYENYIGAGNTDGVTITSSSEEEGNEAIKVIDGSGLDAAKMEAARFLSQASFGGGLAEIDEVLDMGFEAWLDDQKTKPVTVISDMYFDIWDEIYNTYISEGFDEEDVFGPYTVHFNYAWYEMLMTKEDMLRQRMAYALSQILVTSFNSGLADYNETIPYYYDLLLEHSLGNYEDLLLGVSKSIAMGFYLSHFNNPKADPENNVHPDENYAREIMQLFTIGLYELDADGQPTEDVNGDWIPTYDNDDIKELAKVFTGFGPGGINEVVTWTTDPYFGLGMWGADLQEPMMMFDDFHEEGEKILLGGDYVIPSGQTGDQDVEDAVNFLFNHDNVGPFLAYRLIQRLVKSNPTPAYVERVAEAFNDNGEGVRGDLFAVAKAILLDEEARDCFWQEDISNGKLNEPVLTLAKVMKSLPMTASLGTYWNNGYDLLWEMGQSPMYSPTVFNFYQPDHQPIGPLTDDGLVAPEFQIFNTLTSVGTLNKMHHWTLWNFVTYDWEDDEVFGEGYTYIDEVWMEDKIVQVGAEGMMNELDILLTHGQLSEDWRNEIRIAVDSFDWGPIPHAEIAIYLILSHPDFMIAK